jgi:hypothetical protein
MAPESESIVRRTIGHVLFIELAGYSKLLIEEQKERLGQLTDIVRRPRKCARFQTSNSLGSRPRMEWSWCLAIIRRNW